MTEPVVEEQAELKNALWQLRSAKAAGGCLTVLGIFGSAALARLVADILNAERVPGLLVIGAVAVPILMGGFLYNAAEEVSSFLSARYHRLSRETEEPDPASGR